MMRTQAKKAERFQALHSGPDAFVIPNPWDAGTARILAGLGFEALTTTSAWAAREIREHGTFTFAEEAMPYAEANGLMVRP